MISDVTNTILVIFAALALIFGLAIFFDFRI
jgi:hypothetical protein